MSRLYVREYKREQRYIDLGSSICILRRRETI